QQQQPAGQQQGQQQNQGQQGGQNQQNQGQQAQGQQPQGQQPQGQQAQGQQPQGQQNQGQQQGQVSRQQAEAGENIFQQNCATCHGANGTGGIGPALAGNSALQDTQLVVSQIINGGGGMPAFGNVLSDQQIAEVATHIRNSWGND